MDPVRRPTRKAQRTGPTGLPSLVLGYWHRPSQTPTAGLLGNVPFSGVASWDEDSGPDSAAALSLLASGPASFNFGGLCGTETHGRRWVGVSLWWRPLQAGPGPLTHQHALAHVLAKDEFVAGGIGAMG